MSGIVSRALRSMSVSEMMRCRPGTQEFAAGMGPGSGPGHEDDSLRLDPLRRPAPQRVAVLGPEEAKCPTFGTPASFGVMLTISGLVAVKPEHSSSTAVRVAQGSSVKQIARSAPWYFSKFESPARSVSPNM